MINPDIVSKEILVAAVSLSANVSSGSSEISLPTVKALYGDISLTKVLLAKVVEPLYNLNIQGYGPFSSLESFRNDSYKQAADILSLQEIFLSELSRFFTFNEVSNITEALVVNSLKAFNENTGLTESFVFNNNKAFNEALSLVESIVAALSASRSFSENLSLVDTDFTALLGNFQYYNDALALTEALNFSFAYNLTDTLAIAENFTKDLSSIYNENTTITESLNKDLSKLFSENSTTSETSVFLLNNYVDGSYLVSDYVGTVYNF